MSRRKLDRKGEKGKTGEKLLRMPEKSGEMDGEKERKAVSIDSPAKKDSRRESRKELREALKLEVEKESSRIAASLVHQVKNGDLRGAEVVLSLLQKAKEEDAEIKVIQSGPSWAELLASEPEWDENMEAGGQGSKGKLAS